MRDILSKVFEHFNSGNYVKAQKILLELVDQNPENYDLNKMLGMCHMALKRYNAALKSFEFCYSKKKDDVDVLINLSWLFLKVQHYELSLKYSAKAININENNPAPNQNIATCYLHLREFEKAKEFADKTIKMRGGFEDKNFYLVRDLVNLYGDILLALNLNEEFEQFAKKILSLVYEPDLFIRLIRHNKKLISEDNINQIKDVIKKSDDIQSLLERNKLLSSSHFILAEYYSKKNQAESEKNYHLANNYISTMQRQSIYQRQKNTLSVIDFFIKNQNLCESLHVDENKGDGIIFIIGMPRSGTTLTESILSTADDLVAGGEQSFFHLQLAGYINKGLDDKEIFNQDFLDTLGNNYLSQIHILKKNKKFFVDKLPENYLYYKFIKLCLPAAKFINCFRDPWDNAISLFKQNYSVNVFYSSSFFGIANEYANYEHLINYWKSIDGEKCMLDIEYEKIVKQTEDYALKIWEFCNLKGSYSPTKRKEHFGYTASMQQVTKDIFTTSIKKEEFVDFKDAFFEDLKSQRDYLKSKKIKSLN